MKKRSEAYEEEGREDVGETGRARAGEDARERAAAEPDRVREPNPDGAGSEKMDAEAGGGASGEEEEGRAFTDEELEAYFREADEEEEESPSPPFIGSPLFRKLVIGVLAVALCAQVLAIWPQMFSLSALRFLAVSAQLFQSDDIRAYKEAVVVIRSADAKGTGFIISEDGLVVTNRHVVQNELPVVTLPNGDSYTARVAAVSEEDDLALLRLDAEGLPSLTLAEAYGGEAGTPIYIIGNPLFFNGIANEGETIGMLAGFPSAVMGLSAPVYKGNSGSPVIARSGEVIGVVYAVGTIRQGGEESDIGLAVPVDRVRLLMEAL